MQARGELARRHLADYARAVSPDTYEQPPHVLKLIELLEAIERGDLKRAIVTMPPRSSKSTHVSRLFPSWYLGRKPDEGVILASYGDLLATGNGRAVRDMLAHPQYPFSTRLRPDMKAAGMWATDSGGGLLAGGVGTGLTGFGGSLLVADDLIKGREEADSEVVREHTWNWHEEVFMTRLKKGGAVLETSTRWHEDDPIGRILNSPTQARWHVLNLPYEAEPGDALGRAVGELLPIFGEVPPHLSAYAYSALYQQRPTPASGGLFQRAWMKRWASLPPDRVDERGKRYAGTWVLVQFVDTAWDKGVGHDYSAIGTWATDGVDYYLLDLWRDRVEYPDLKVALRERFTGQRWPVRAILVEDAANGRPLVQELKRTGLPVVGRRPSGSKEARADAVTPYFEAGHVYLPPSADWVDAYVEELVGFPAVANDEQVDITSGGLGELVQLNSRHRGQVDVDVKGVTKGYTPDPEKSPYVNRLRERLAAQQHAGGTMVRPRG